MEQLADTQSRSRPTSARKTTRPKSCLSKCVLLDEIASLSEQSLASNCSQASSDGCKKAIGSEIDLVVVQMSALSAHGPSSHATRQLDWRELFVSFKVIVLIGMQKDHFLFVRADGFFNQHDVQCACVCMGGMMDSCAAMHFFSCNNTHTSRTRQHFLPRGTCGLGGGVVPESPECSSEGCSWATCKRATSV